MHTGYKVSRCVPFAVVVKWAIRVQTSVHFKNPFSPIWRRGALCGRAAPEALRRDFGWSVSDRVRYGCKGRYERESPPRLRVIALGGARFLCTQGIS
ncbi:hypothetical protein EVAR_33402_1 [Eumeta japonica]|uniref:Uncharacterized protein n=1 Tax=Eumeta variegata TaxID=151549 RepID=A0A4C1W4E2_EUMVA|nr:hypothetical protein EVAR_33402_1 [Eumeta japonica]